MIYLILMRMVTTKVEGLEKTIKFEVSAGDKKKQLEIDPAGTIPGITLLLSILQLKQLIHIAYLVL